ncbi:MAG TPA: zinc transporter ZntB [Mariprofundaceae bacterium]|nr:zinc transporter ZntB [Mariprofundaceae bacterium]
MSDANGLIFSFILNNGSGQTVGWEKIKDWTPDQGILWMHLDYEDEDAKKWLSGESGLDEITLAGLLAEDARPRVVTAADSMLLVLRGVNCNPGADPEDMVSLRLWLDEHRIISLRHRRVMAIDDINKDVLAGKGPGSTNDFLVTVANKLVDRMGDVVSEIDDNVDELEDMVLTQESYELRPKLADIRRKTISLRRYISPQRDVLARLQNEKASWLSDMDRMHIREITERTARFVDDLDAARDRAAITQEELNNHLSEQMNKTMYILSIVAAIFLPLGLITGLLGINVGGIPGTENRFAFTIVSISLFILALLILLVFRRKKWI